MSVPPNNPTTPSEPTSFAIDEQVNGTLGFKIGSPIVKPTGTLYQVIKSTATLATATTVIFEGVAQQINLLVPNTTQWYFVRCIANSYQSALFPNTYGVGALPADLLWTASVDSVPFSTIA